MTLSPIPENITHQRCFNHSDREAAARCPSCARFFCRECVTEHKGRVLCAGCIAVEAAANRSSKGIAGGAVRFLFFLLSFWMAWFFFYHAGRIFLELPDEFHDGTFWKIR